MIESEILDEKILSIGELFKQEREKQNISLEHACQVLKIRKFFLNAIENNNFSDLPGGVYSAGFIQSYAKFLKIDASFLKNILHTLQPSPLSNSPSNFSLIKEETYFSPGVLGASFIFSLIILITFLAFRTDFVSSNQKVVPSNSLTLPLSTVQQFDPSQLNPAFITFYALDHTWIKVTNDKEKTVATKLLSPGEIYQFDRQEGLYLTTGNSQSLKVYVGAKSVPLPSSLSMSLTASLLQNQELLEDFPLK